MTGDIHDPRPKGADDALQAGTPIRELTPAESAELVDGPVAAAAGPDPTTRPPVPIAESLGDPPGWPYDAAILAPPGYEYRHDGIGRMTHPPLLGDDGQPVLVRKQVVPDRSRPPVWTVTRRQLVAIVGRARDIATGAEVLTVAWHRDGRWHDRAIPREVVRDSRRVVRVLAALGIDVTSDDASSLVAWLASCEGANQRTIPCQQVSSAMGWQGGALTTWLWGREDIGAESIAYQGQDAGGEALADAYRAQGTMAEWQAAVAPCAAHPHVLAAIYTALAAPLLAILDGPSWVLDLCSPTSQGKTSTLQAAASVWGQPDPAREPSAVRTWDTTPIGVERTCAALGSLPLMLDDTSRARAGDVPTVVYAATSGQGRMRGTPDGTARVGRWRLPTISTGEQPLRSYGTAGGRTARTMTLWGSPWVGDAGSTVRGVVAGVREHYGHAGPALIRYLQAHRDCWPGLREQYRRTRDAYVARAEGPTQERLAEYVAVLAVTITVADLAGVTPWPLPVDLLEGLWPRLAEEVRDAHGAAEALAAVYGVAVSQRESYWSLVERHRPDGTPVADYQPPAGWHGRWDYSCDWQYLGILPQVLTRHLTELGYPYDATVRAWGDRGWLHRDIGHMTQHVRFAGEKARLVCIRRAALVETGMVTA